MVFNEMSSIDPPVISTSAASRFLAIPEMLESTLAEATIPAAHLLALQRVCGCFQQVIKDTPCLQRKVFAKHAIDSSKEPAVNTMFTPQNVGMDPFATYYSRKNRFALADDASHVYETHWAKQNDYDDTKPVLCVEIFKRRSAGRKVLPKPFLDGFLCDMNVEVLGMLKSEDDYSEEIESGMWVEGGVRFGQVFEKARMWADGEL